MAELHRKYRYIYGPVFSWRLGRSLGIDPISCKDKVCSFDCIYCQVGNTEILSSDRKEYVPAKEIIEEIKSLPSLEIDYITFSGKGEPTLAKNLGEIIKEIRKTRKEKIAVITNASLIHKKDVQLDLSLADFVMVKLDAPSEEAFRKINRPMPDKTIGEILKGIKGFRSFYKGRLALQVMFIEENYAYAKDLVGFIKGINPDEVQINTPLRPCAVKALSKEQLDSIKSYFDGMNCTYVYDKRKS